jgi:hypothetical protein
MADQSIYFVGNEAEVGHHAAPLQERLAKVVVATPDRVLNSAQPADLAIFSSEHFDRFRDTCCQLKQRNVATLYLIDGILEWRNAWDNREDEPACPWTMRPVLSHKVACIGPSQARVLQLWGNESKVELVGIPRLDLLCNQGIVAPRESSSRNFKMLVMTAKWPGFTEEQVENAVNGLRDVRDFVKEANRNGSSIEVVWRLTQGLDQRIDVQNSLTDLTGKELAETLKEVDAVITTPSTAMLEAMLTDRPVAILDYNNTPQYVPAAWQITAREHLPCVISQLQARPENRMFLQRSIVEDALTTDGKACERLKSLVCQMLQISSELVAQGEPLRFPPGMLPVPVQPTTKLQHGRVYPGFSEFHLADTIESQSQLAHSRREIKYLQSVIAQLQSELDEAHGIFEQIRRHPIAGPIVRAREKLIDWIERFRERSDADTPGGGEPLRSPVLEMDGNPEGSTIVDAPAKSTPWH